MVGIRLESSEMDAHSFDIQVSDFLTSPSSSP